MAKVLQKALQPQQPASAYEMLMAELAREQEAPAPMFSPEQQQQRVGQHNQALELGILGTMAPDEQINRTGGSVFKKALADREERVTNRGVMNPVTGEESLSPQYQAEQREQRRGRVLQQALGHEDREAARMDRHIAREDNQAFRAQQAAEAANLRREIAGGRRATDQEMLELRKDLVRSQIQANEARASATGEKASREKGKVEGKAQLQSMIANDKANNVIAKVDRAIGSVGSLTAGTVGGKIFSMVPGTGAYNLSKDLATIKANIGFKELSEMRMASPTGGALGNVSNVEIDFLQSVIANLDQSQGPERLRTNLAQIRTHFDRWKRSVALSARQTAGEDVSDEIQALMSEATTAQGGSTPGASSYPSPAPAPAAAPVQAPAPAPAAPRRMRYDPATGQLVPVQ